jgi:hypothetical protein
LKAYRAIGGSQSSPNMIWQDNTAYEKGIW